MANPEHLEILKQGVEIWNKWREGHPETLPDFSRAILIDADLIGTDLSSADLSGADLVDAKLNVADLSRADLSRAWLINADLSDSDLNNADLNNADLSNVNLSRGDLSGADLSYAKLIFVNLGGTSFGNADFTNVELGYTLFGDNDLSQVGGLETVIHKAPSSIGIDTIYQSRGIIPEIFLRGCGVPEEFITYMRSLTKQPIQFYKSFISYSSKDQKFADRLYANLQNKGVRCWLATEDLKIGDRIRVGIDEAIRLHDKLLLVLSKHSVASDWVEQEVETALERERKEKRTVLFPIRLDDTVMKVESGWPALVRNTRNIGDFRKWKNHDSYQRAFDRLLRDLKAET